jgi:hypothetical protein
MGPQGPGNERGTAQETAIKKIGATIISVIPRDVWEPRKGNWEGEWLRVGGGVQA